MTLPKIIVIGNPGGNIRPVLTKLTALHSKNAFSCAIVTGNLFGLSDDDTVSDILSGSLLFPLPTYFTYGTTPLPPSILARVTAGEDICENLIFLGTRGVITTIDKLRIATLGGTLDANLDGTETLRDVPVFSRGDASALRGAGSVDILITASWPAGIQKNSNVQIVGFSEPINGIKEIADLCAVLKPLYHLTASKGDFFYEREPLLHPTPPVTDYTTIPPAPKITRFISMAPYGNSVKAKALYAFTFNRENTEVSPGTTPSPFEYPQSRKHKQQDEGYSRFGNSHDSDRGRQKRKRQQSPPPGPDRCFFCLSNPNFETHMCASIGNESYLATAKGPITKGDTFQGFGVDFPCHFLMIPLPHAPTIAGMSSGDIGEGTEAERTWSEMNKFRESLHKMLAVKSSGKLGAVTWEISRGRNIHVHWQFLAVSKELLLKGLVEAGFRFEAENLKYPSFVEDYLSLEKQIDAGDYFRVWLWSDKGEKSLVMKLDSESRFDLQFGRRVMCKLLGLEDRVRWQDCAQDTAEETTDVEKFQAMFKPWDFTLEE